MATIETETLHVWEAKGHGKAPFRLVGLITLPGSMVAEKNPSGYQNAIAEASEAARGLGVHCGTCDVCGTGILNNFVIESADRKRFVVGCDCVHKSGDAGLIKATDRITKAKAKQKRSEARAARAAAEWVRTRPEREARQAEWERQERERREREAQNASDNRWIIDVLESTPHGVAGFIDSMINDLNRCKISDIHPNAIKVLAQVYAKQVGGRAGSQAYQEANAEFWTRVG